jgi:hypothetical protein
VFTDRFAAEYEQFKCRAAGVLVIVTAHLEPVARTHDDELTAAYRSPCGTNAVKARRLAINPAKGIENMPARSRAATSAWQPTTCTGLPVRLGGIAPWS